MRVGGYSKKIALIVVMALLLTFVVSSVAAADPPEWVVQKNLNKKAAKFKVPPGHQYYVQMCNRYNWGMPNDCPYTDYKPITGPSEVDIDADVNSDQITITYDENIEYVRDNNYVLDGITIINLTDNEKIDIDDVDIDGNELVIKLSDELEDDAKYRIFINGNVLKDEDGYLSAFSYIFSTEDNDDLNVVSVDPENLERNVDVDKEVLTIKFNEEIQPVKDMDDVLDGVTVRNLTDNDDLEIYDIDIDGNELTIELEDNLEYDCKYNVVIKADIVESVDGDNLDYYSWAFYTED